MSPDRLTGGLVTATAVPAGVPAGPSGLEPVRGDVAGLVAYLTFALAGRLADVDATVIRTRVADGDIEEALRLLRSTLDGSGVELTQAEARVAHTCLAGGPDTAPNLRVVETPTRPPFHFSPAPDGPAARLLAAAISVADWVDGLAGVWLTLRTSDRATAVPVWLCEALVGSDLIELTGELQHRLALHGEVPPRVEVFTREAPLTDYHRDALAGADLVWVAPDLPALQIARTYDGADPNTGPYFEADHLRLAGSDRVRMLAYLTGAEVVLSGGKLPDVLAPASDAVVPMAFRCDGTWIWTEAVTYYLQRYGLVPDPALTQHILRASGSPPPCSPLTRARALAAISAPETSTVSESNGSESNGSEPIGRRS